MPESTSETLSWTRGRLEQLHLQLQLVHAAVVTAAVALHGQNAERDEEIARMLEHCAGTRLYRQIEHTARLIDRMRARQDRDTGTAPWNLERESGKSRARRPRQP